MSTLDDALRFEMLTLARNIAANDPKRETEMEIRKLGYKTRDPRGRPQCPVCWVRPPKHGLPSPMTPIGGDDRNDYLRCDTCGSELASPL